MTASLAASRHIPRIRAECWVAKSDEMKVSRSPRGISPASAQVRSRRVTKFEFHEKVLITKTWNSMIFKFYKLQRGDPMTTSKMQRGDPMIHVKSYIKNTSFSLIFINMSKGGPYGHFKFLRVDPQDLIN